MSIRFTIAVKALLAILFFSCLADMPYGYFQLVRFMALLGFALLAYASYENDRPVELIIYVGLAVLFQPIVKIALGRDVWNIVDVVVAICLLLSIFMKPAKNPET